MGQAVSSRTRWAKTCFNSRLQLMHRQPIPTQEQAARRDPCAGVSTRRTCSHSFIERRAAHASQIASHVRLVLQALGRIQQWQVRINRAPKLQFQGSSKAVPSQFQASPDTAPRPTHCPGHCQPRQT
jgi:hypothetical protein